MVGRRKPKASINQIIEKIELLLESRVEHRNDAEDGVSIKPWERTVNTTVSIPDKPKALNIVLANRLYWPISQVPNPLIAQFNKLASFSNPKFFKAQGLRLSTNGIARFICLAELDSGYLSLPRGCWGDLKAICSELGIALRYFDIGVASVLERIVNPICRANTTRLQRKRGGESDRLYWCKNSNAAQDVQQARKRVSGTWLFIRINNPTAIYFTSISNRYR